MNGLSAHSGPHWSHVMAAGAVIGLVPVIVVFIFLQRFFIRGLTEGATKG